VQLGHAVGRRALEADDDDDVAVQLAALEGGEQSSWSSNTAAGASMTRCSGFTAETLMTARPRLPVSRRRPPSGLNGSETGRRMSVSRLSVAPSRQTS
jgi:hypothetical protein